MFCFFFVLFLILQFKTYQMSWTYQNMFKIQKKTLHGHVNQWSNVNTNMQIFSWAKKKYHKPIQNHRAHIYCHKEFRRTHMRNKIHKCILLAQCVQQVFLTIASKMGQPVVNETKPKTNTKRTVCIRKTATVTAATETAANNVRWDRVSERVTEKERERETALITVVVVIETMPKPFHSKTSSSHLHSKSLYKTRNRTNDRASKKMIELASERERIQQRQQPKKPARKLFSTSRI